LIAKPFRERTDEIDRPRARANENIALFSHNRFWLVETGRTTTASLERGLPRKRFLLETGKNKARPDVSAEPNAGSYELTQFFCTWFEQNQIADVYRTILDD
jgi:hypothetical protein